METPELNRRSFLKQGAQASALFAIPLSVQARTLSRTTRLVFISGKEIARSSSFLTAMDAILSPHLSAWRTALTVFDPDRDAVAIGRLLSIYGPNTKLDGAPILVRLPNAEVGEFDEVETWTEEWIAAATNKDLTNGCYPVDPPNSWWSVEGDWRPSIEKVRRHLFLSPNHTSGEFTQEWLNLLEFAELQSLHSDHHREMTGQGEVIWDNVNAECPTPPM
jgi:hypothetical protein